MWMMLSDQGTFTSAYLFFFQTHGVLSSRYVYELNSAGERAELEGGRLGLSTDLDNPWQLAMETIPHRRFRARGKRLFGT